MCLSLTFEYVCYSGAFFSNSETIICSLSSTFLIVLTFSSPMLFPLFIIRFTMIMMNLSRHIFCRTMAVVLSCFSHDARCRMSQCFYFVIITVITIWRPDSCPPSRIKIQWLIYAVVLFPGHILH